MFCDKKFIGQKFKEYRKNLKLSQEKLAERIGIAEKHYGRIERGICMPGLDTFFKLANTLNIPLSEFGVYTKNPENKLRKKLVEEIYLLNESELEAYFNIFKTIRKL